MGNIFNISLKFAAKRHSLAKYTTADGAPKLSQCAIDDFIAGAQYILDELKEKIAELEIPDNIPKIEDGKK